jgi:hypothetical protein
VGPGPEAGGVERVEALGQQRPGEAGEHVPGAAGGQRRHPGGIDGQPPVGVGDHRVVALEQHGRPPALRLAGGLLQPRPGGVGGEPGELAGVRGQQGRSPPLGQRPAGAEGEQAVGVDHGRALVGGQQPPDHLLGAVGPPQPRPDPDGGGLTQPAPAGVVGVAGQPPARLGQGHGQGLGHGRPDPVGHRGGHGQHQQPGAGAAGGQPHQGRGPTHARAAPDQQQHPAAALVLLGPGHRDQAGQVRGLAHPPAAGLQGQPDVGHLQPAHALAARGQDVAGLDRLEGHGDGGRDRLAGDLAGGPVDPRGDVDRDHRGAGGLGGRDRLGHRPPGGAARAGAEESVQDQVGPGQQPGRQAGLEGPHPASGPPDQGRATPPLGVQVVRVAGDQRLGPGAAPGQPRQRLQGVAAVVALAGQGDHPPPGHRTQLADGRGRHRRPGPSHQRLDRGPGLLGGRVGRLHRRDGREGFHDPAEPPPRWRSRRRRTHGGGPEGRRG